MKLLYPLLLLSMSLCLAETQVKPEMTWDEFSERYEQMDRNALSCNDVDFLRRACELSHYKCEDVIALSWDVESKFLYYSMSEQLMDASEVDRDKPHFLIQILFDLAQTIGDVPISYRVNGAYLFDVDSQVYRTINGAYLFDVESQVYRRIKKGEYDGFQTLVNQKYYAYEKAYYKKNEPLLLEWISLCQKHAKPTISPQNLECWLAQAPFFMCGRHGVFNDAGSEMSYCGKKKGLSELPSYVIVALEIVETIERQILVGSSYPPTYKSPKKYLCYRYDEEQGLYVFDDSRPNLKWDGYYAYELQRLPISEKNFESLRPDLSE